MKLKSLLALVTFVLLQISSYGQVEYEGTLVNESNQIVLDNGEIKYTRYHKAEKTMVIYNSDHSEWKSVTLPLPRQLYFDELKSISTNVFNSDPLIELVYTCVEYRSNNELEGTTNYVDVAHKLFVINEEGALVLEVENSNHMEIMDNNGTRKLWVYKQNEEGKDRKEQVAIYSLPDYQTTKSKVEQKGEYKYPTFGERRGI
jgi:hypothetical protein